MANTRCRWKVYRIEKHEYLGMGIDSERKDFAGETFAVSGKQAANNVAHRNGETPFYQVPWECDGSRTVVYTAEKC